MSIFTRRADCEDQQTSTPGYTAACCSSKF